MGHSLEKGLIQRVTALNAFLADIYGAGDILKGGNCSCRSRLSQPCRLPHMAGRRVPYDIFVHIAGVDIVRTDDQGFFVLRIMLGRLLASPDMLENREVMMRLFPELFALHRVAPIESFR